MSEISFFINNVSETTWYIKMKLKFGESKARGYCGYHVTWDNKRVYLRSLKEFIVACMLDCLKIPYLTERQVFTFPDKNYKPDFFLYEDTGYTKYFKIIEVKDPADKEAHRICEEKYKPFFESVGIEYELIRKFDGLSTKYCPKSKQDEWRSATKDLPANKGLSGENNPMFGANQREETKALIGRLAKERNLDPEYRENNSKKQKMFWETDRGKQRKIEISNQRKEEARQRRLAKEKLPDFHIPCKTCGADVVSKTGEEFCNQYCAREWRYSNIDGYGKHKDKIAAGNRRLWKYIDMILNSTGITESEFFSNLEKYVILAKQQGTIPKNKGMSRKTLTKFKIIEESENGEIKIYRY